MCIIVKVYLQLETSKCVITIVVFIYYNDCVSPFAKNMLNV